MRTPAMTAPLGATVYPVRTLDDLSACVAWAEATQEPIAFDIEASGLHVYGDDWQTKTVQIGDRSTAWVVNAQSALAPTVVSVLLEAQATVAHNAAFDLAGLQQAGLLDGWGVDHLWRTVTDTLNLAKLADPRSKPEGGTGHALKDLAQFHLGNEAVQGESALKELFRSNGWKQADGYRLIHADDPTLVLYGGLDVIVTAQLLPVLLQAVEDRGVTHLIHYEMALSRLCSEMARRGVRVDLDHAHQLVADLTERARLARGRAAVLGVENPNSTRQVAEALIADNVELTATTPTGQWKIDKTVLESIEHPLAEAILEAKEADKARTAWVQKVIDLESGGRVHPSVQTMGARTGRMSVSNPAAQQFPSTKSTADERGQGEEIRDLFLAEEGEVMVAVDFSGLELRVLAACSQDETMMEAFARGDDLHAITARNAGTTRDVGKMANFLTVYGGSATALCAQARIPMAEAKEVLAAFKRTFPGYQRWANKLKQSCDYGNRDVVTRTGRRLPVDRDRTYAATNYVIQSTARDVMGQAMVQLDDAGLWPYVRMVIHDECLFSFPADQAEELTLLAMKAMTITLDGVEMEVEAEIGGPSWGSLYSAEGGTKVSLR